MLRRLNHYNIEMTSAIDHEKLKNEDLWHGGPLFELYLVFDTDCDLLSVDQYFRDTGNFSYLPSPSATLKRAAFNFAQSNLIGAELSYYTSNNRVSQKIFTISFRPIQLKMLFGSDLSSESSPVIDLAKKASLALFITALINLVDGVRSDFKIRFATMSSEIDGYANLQMKTPDGLYTNCFISETLSLPIQNELSLLCLISEGFQKSDFSFDCT